MRTFAIVNRKGGVGKTTTAVNLAYVLATSCHLRVLLVDADGQANATQILLPRGEYAGLGALLRGYTMCMRLWPGAPGRIRARSARWSLMVRSAVWRRPRLFWTISRRNSAG